MKCSVMDTSQVVSKLMRMMRIIFFCLLALVVQVSAKGFGQKKISVQVKDMEIAAILANIEHSSNYRFLYNNQLQAMRQKTSLEIKEADIKEVLARLFRNTGLGYQLMENNLVVVREEAGRSYEEVTIKGKVKGEEGNALAGVSVQVKGGTRGTTTDAGGNYTIVVSDLSILVFSFVGYDTTEVAVAGKTTVDVTLKAGNQQLGEVVVVGYGTQRRRDLTGSVANIKGEELAKQPVQTPTQALQGKAAGVQIISSGQPNTAPTVRIRGTGTAFAGANPLYVVDGVITTDIRNINNSDIVSVDVLKDASAEAVYGMRAANGVILITTKQGKTGKPVVSYNSNIGFRQVAKKLKMANSQQYLDYLQEAAPGTDVTGLNANTDWYGAILRNGLQQSHTIALSGGSESVKYYFSAGYFGDEGIVINNKFQRLSLRSNNQFILSDQVKVIAQLSYSTGETYNVNLASAYNDAYRAAPIIPSVVNGKYGNTSAFGNVGNPVLDIKGSNNRAIENRLQGNLALEYKPIQALTLKSALNVDYATSGNRVYGYQYLNDANTFITTGGNQQNPTSDLNISNDNGTRLIWDNTATFAQKFGDHDLTVLGGVLAETYKYSYLQGLRQNVPATEDAWYLALGDPNTATNNSTGDKVNRISYVARLNYGYKGKYLLTGTVRYEGTSKFSNNNRYLTSPAIGAAWVVSEEGFMKNQQLFNFLKIRASWGRVGNDQVPSNLYLLTATSNIPYFFNGQPVLGAAIDTIKDENLKWEITQEYDLGLEFGLFKNKLRGELTYYNKKTKDALIYVNIPAVLGAPSGNYVTNAASFTNKGLELGLNWKDNLNKKWSYSIGGNITFNQNRIVGLAQGQPIFDGGVGQQGFTTYSTNGVAIGTFYVLQAQGVFQTQEEVNNYKNKDGLVIQPNAKPGDLKYLDKDGNGTIDPSDRVFAGSYQPKVYYGINTGISYGSIDLSLDFFGNAGNKVYNGKKAFRYQSTDNIEASYAGKRWTSARPSTTDPSTLQSNTPASTYFIESGDFFRLNNITLGYTFPAGLLKKWRMSQLRLYVTSQNLFTVSPYSGFTPELPGSPTASGIELNAYPTTRTFAAGVNVTF